MENKDMEDFGNFIGLIGKLDGARQMDYFHIYNLRVPRKSGTEDMISVRVPFPVLDAHPDIRDAPMGCAVIASGRVRKEVHGKGRPTEVYVEAGFVGVAKHPFWQNDVSLKGTVANTPFVRVTSKGRSIADVMLSIPDAGGGQNVRIPCVCWGRNAERAAILEPGARLEVRGRLQSRCYVKKNVLDGGMVAECRLVREVSVSYMRF